MQGFIAFRMDCFCQYFSYITGKEQITFWRTHEFKKPFLKKEDKINKKQKYRADLGFWGKFLNKTSSFFLYTSYLDAWVSEH